MGFNRFLIDVFSSSELVLLYVLSLYTLITFNTYSLFVMIFLVFQSQVILKYIKKLMKKSPLGKRPSGAHNCNIFGCGGKPHTGGIISGHMSSITIMSTLLLLNFYDMGKYNNYKLLYILLVVGSTGIARLLSKCHTLFQIVTGLFMGIVMGSILYFIDKMLTKNIKKFSDDKDELYKFVKKVD